MEEAADGSTPIESAGIPQGSLSAVSKAMDRHSTARHFLTRALLTATSLCAAGESVLHTHVMMSIIKAHVKCIYLQS